VLYIEDEDINWIVAEYELSQCCIIHRAKNAFEVFERLAQDTYDLLLMDIKLKGSDLDGLQITRVLKGRYQGWRPAYARYTPPAGGPVSASEPLICPIPIIVVTGSTASYNLQDILLAGAEDLISKPVDYHWLGLVIARVAAGHKGVTESPHPLK
jgi:CheY-like chemotaxis protein